MSLPAPGCVLVVDDEPANRKLLADLVTREGFQALTASGGAEALARLDEQPVDLVLLDLMMPAVDGMDVLSTMASRGLLPGLPVVVVTAHDDRTARHAALGAGAVDYLTKPIDRVEVGCKVRTLTELRRLREAALAQRERAARARMLTQLEAAVEGLPVMIYELHMADVQHMTGSWVVGDIEQLSGLSREAFLGGGDFLQQVHPDDRSAVAGSLERALAGVQPRWTNRFRLDAGGWRLHTASFDEAEGCVRGVLLAIDDLVAVEEQLLQSQKMDAVGQLAGGIAHDFNNILGAIMVFTGMAHDALPEGETAREDLAEVLAAAERAAGLTRQLLTFSRQTPTCRQPIDLAQRLDQLRAFLGRSLGEHIELEITADSHPAEVLFDPIQFDQVLMNLAVNARDVMPDGGRLGVRLEADPPAAPERRVRVHVTDSGPGMDEATRRRVFEPFFTTKPEGQGTGLGLSICFGIVTGAGGTLGLDSAPGQGTTFTIDLPACDEAAAARCEPLPAIRQGQGEDVLLAEDDGVLRDVTRRVLEAAGYRVHGAADGAEAIGLIDRLGARLRVIVSDVMMPDVSGYQVADHAARVAPQAAVLLTSGYLDGTLRRFGRDELPVLWKPLSAHELVRAVAGAIEQSRPAEPAAPAPRVVLVVEDDDMVGRLLARILASGGYAVERTASNAGARRLVEAGLRPWAVLCDLTLTDGSSAAFLDWIERAHPELRGRCVLLTGGATDPEGIRLVDGGRFRVVTKPVQKQRLLEILEALNGRDDDRRC